MSEWQSSWHTPVKRRTLSNKERHRMAQAMGRPLDKNAVNAARQGKLVEGVVRSPSVGEVLSGADGVVAWQGW